VKLPWRSLFARAPLKRTSSMCLANLDSGRGRKWALGRLPGQSCSNSTPGRVVDGARQDAGRGSRVRSLYGLGTNAGLNRVAHGDHGESAADLRYVLRRYVRREQLRQAIADVVNATFRMRKGFAAPSRRYPPDETHLRRGDGPWTSRVGSSWLVVSGCAGHGARSQPRREPRWPATSRTPG
jgi:hypothetical protein